MRSAPLSAARRGSMLALAVASFALPGASSAAQATVPRAVHPGAILVQATDTSINPIPAEIVLPAFGLGIRLSEEGAALLVNIPDGLYLVQARRLGYRPDWRMARVQRDTARLDFVLAPAHGANGGLAEARLRDFLNRSGRMESASFITRSEIERRRPRNLVALLSRLGGITVDRAGPGPSVVRSGRARRPDCGSGMLLFVDGMLPMPSRLTGDPELLERSVERPTGGWRSDRSMRDGGIGVSDARWPGGRPPREAGAEPMTSGGRTSPRRLTSPVDWVPISLVGAIEVYPAVTDAPAEFRVTGAECGVVLVWTTRK